MSDNFTFIDLFAGIGGFKKALNSVGGKCIAFSEISKDAIDAYTENFEISKKLNLGDIRKIKELPSHDILTAGVPCQSWSIAGKNLGFDDDRGQLWNDTIFLLNQSKPKSFIFENVKGLVDPRNREPFSYILKRIKEAGYFAKHYVINSHDYGVAQNRIRVYIVGFKEEKYFKKFTLPQKNNKKVTLADVIGIEKNVHNSTNLVQLDLFGNPVQTVQMSLSSKNGFNDYFMFNDLRNGHSTIHSWDIKDTTEKQKEICLLLLRNRRKKQYGPLDGNPLSLKHFQQLDSSINKSELEFLVNLEIIKKIDYTFEILDSKKNNLTEIESFLLDHAYGKYFNIDNLKIIRSFKVKRISIKDTIESLQEKNIIKCIEERYDFKNTKISSGLYGINRVFMPSSDVFPTLVASDTNDYISLKDIDKKNHKEYKSLFLKEIFLKDNFRKITKEEACLIQGFPKKFKLPNSRPRWMKLIGNSVSVPVIESLAKSIVDTGILINNK